jgi:integron integrase
MPGDGRGERQMVDGVGAEPVVRLWLRHRTVELMFERGFSKDDVEVVKAIPGRRWLPDRLVWTLPNAPRTMDSLVRALGSRLEITEARTDDRHPAAHDPGEPPPGPLDHVDSLLDTLRRTIRARGYSAKTERAYVGWVRRFVQFAAAARRPGDLEGSHARAFLEHLATAEGLAAGSRNQAAAPKRVPTVLTHREVLRVLTELHGKYFLVAMLLYSAGLRLEECLRLRVKDIDFELRQILVRDGKGRKDRHVPLARRAVDLLRTQIARVAELHHTDRAEGHGWAPLPGALHRKDPAAGHELAWQYVFPAATLHEDPATGRTGRWPLHATAVQREVKAAVRRSGIPKRATCHTFRHSFATEALRGGCDIRTLQHVMGHKDIRTTMIYLHVVEQTGFYIRSPLDRPDDPDDFDLDPVGRPWGSVAGHHDLATLHRAGDPKSPHQQPDHPRREEGSRRREGPPGEEGPRGRN